jgi:hypothetical protein
MFRALTCLAMAGAVVTAATIPAVGQVPARKRTQVTALPALNYDSDEGFGYGVVGGIYRYDDDDRSLYTWSLEPTIFFTTNGRREVFLFSDMPYLFGGAWRLSINVGFSRECCAPYYGFGNGSEFDPALAADSIAPRFYTYDRDRWTFVANLQWRAKPTLRFLAGLAVFHNASESRGPNTRFAEDVAAGVVPTETLSAASVGPKFGIVFDTRDFERDPHRGVWIAALVWQGLEFLGSATSFTRVTGAARGYLPLGPSFTLAGRVLGERIAGTMSVSMMPNMGSSFRDYEGIGGGSSVRGVFRARFLGGSRFLGNAELRWRGGQFSGFGARMRFGAVAFVDAGREWDVGGTDPDRLPVGRGAGFRWSWGDAFVVAIDFGHGTEAGTQMYLGLGHLF